MSSFDRSMLRIVVLGLLFMQGACGGKSEMQEPERTYIRLPRATVTPEFVMQHDFIVDHRRDDVFMFGYLTHEELEKLSVAERKDLIELDGEQWSKIDFDPQTLQRRDADVESAVPTENYHDYEALTAELQTLQAAHPDLIKIETAGQSVRGRELWYAKISDSVALNEAEPKLLYIANMHGDETVGRELMIYLIRQLVNEYETNPRIKALVDNAQIFIMPSMNPDGFENGQRWNANGVDLNRAFPDMVSDKSDSPNGRAKEVQAIMELHKQHHFVMALNFHGGDVVFNLPWDTKANNRADQKFADDALIYSLGREYADANATMRKNTKGSFTRGLTYGFEWYEVNGGMQDWAIHWRRSIHATVELSVAKYPGSSGLPRYWTENNEALLRFLEQGTRGVHVAAVGADGQAIAGPVTITNGRRTLAYDSAFISRPSLGTAQTVTLSAPGFQDMTVTLQPDYFMGAFTPVQMQEAR